MVWRHVKKHPFVAMLLLGLALEEIGAFLGILYDSGGAGSLLLFWLPVFLTFPVWIAHELLRSIDFLHAIYVSRWVAIAFGLFIALGFDYVLSILAAAVRRNRRAAA